MSLRGAALTVKAARRLGVRPPKGTSHVLEHIPAWQLTPDDTGGLGTWKIQTLGNFVNGTPTGDGAETDAAASHPGPDLAAFTAAALGYPVSLTRFEVETSYGPDSSTDPAFYIRRA